MMEQKYKNYRKNLEGIGEVSGYSLLKLNLNQVSMMAECGISVDDARYVEMYEEYVRLIEEGAKKKVTILYLAEKYFLGVSTVKRAIGRFQKKVRVR